MRLKLKKITAIFLTAFLIMPFINATSVKAEDIITIHYDGENNDGLGITMGGTFETAARYPNSLLQPNLGKRIKAVKVYFHDVCPTTLKLYKGSSGNTPANLVYSKQVQTIAGWNTFEIDQKILITEDDLWAGYEVTHQMGQFPAGIDAGPANPDGCYMRSNVFYDGAWKKLTDYGFNCNWNLRIELIFDNVTAPVISNFSINNNQNITNNPAVSLNINAADDVTPKADLKMRFSNNNTDWSTWEAYNSTKSWTMSSGDGEKTVFIQVRDEDYNVANSSDSIILDTAPPVLASSDPADDGTEFERSNNIILTFNENIYKSDAFNNITLKDSSSLPVDFNAEVSENKLIINPSVILKPQTQYKLQIPVNGIKDLAGNGSSSITVAFTTSQGDITPPSFSVSGNPTGWTNGNVTLKITATDEESKLNDNGAYSFDGGKTWTNETSKTFTANGTVKIKVRDNFGNIASRDIIIDKIDKIPPVITVNPYTTGKTSDSITVTVSVNEGTLNTAIHTFTENGSFDFIAMDAAGNKTVKTVTINNITAGLPQTGSIFDFNLMVTAGMAMMLLGLVTMAWKKSNNH